MKEEWRGKDDAAMTMQPSEAELETLLAHEARYFEIWSRVERSEQAWFLDARDMLTYHSANRAMRLRYADRAQRTRGPEPIVTQIMAHYLTRRLPVVVDVDPVAEEQGWGRALRQRGITPVVGSTVLMRHDHAAPGRDTLALPACPEPAVVSLPPHDLESSETREWVALAGCDETTSEEADFWRQVAKGEATSPDCRLYLARVDGKAAGACQLFSSEGWGQIDSVMTHPDFRRRGIARQLVSCALGDSQARGNERTYLYTERGGPGERLYHRLGFTIWGVDVLRRHILW